MNKYNKCKVKSIFREVDYQGVNPAVTTVTEELAPQGTIACLRTFSAWTGYANYQNVSFDGADSSKTASVSFNKKDSSSTTLLDLFIPIQVNQHLLGGVGSSGAAGSFFNIPGPGIFFDDGLEVVISIPPNVGNGVDSNSYGPIMACMNVVYSL